MHAVDFCASANFFWHAEPEALYDADDVFGNKDLVGAQRALNAAHACRAALRCGVGDGAEWAESMAHQTSSRICCSLHSFFTPKAVKITSLVEC